MLAFLPFEKYEIEILPAAPPKSVPIPPEESLISTFDIVFTLFALVYTGDLIVLAGTKGKDKYEIEILPAKPAPARLSKSGPHP